MAWEVADIEATVATLRMRGVVFEEYDLPGLKTVNGIAGAAPDDQCALASQRFHGRQRRMETAITRINAPIGKRRNRATLVTLSARNLRLIYR
jgi:hypothetical protein